MPELQKHLLTTCCRLRLKPDATAPIYLQIDGTTQEASGSLDHGSCERGLRGQRGLAGESTSRMLVFWHLSKCAHVRLHSFDRELQLRILSGFGKPRTIALSGF